MQREGVAATGRRDGVAATGAREDAAGGGGGDGRMRREVLAATGGSDAATGARDPIWELLELGQRLSAPLPAALRWITRRPLLGR